jgi:prepilin-type N-terminal cleavage/methylation domain-containing protein
MRTIISREDSATRKGFTLVELAIVITIIGLLIGGILKGQEMIRNARVTATIAQVQSYLAATETFRDRFDNLPGDMPAARARLSGCTDAAFCYNGDGNSLIGIRRLPWRNEDLALITAENVQYWKHLALADLIAGVNPATSAVEWGQALPSAALAGGYSIVQGLSSATDTAAMDALQLRLQNCTTCANLEASGTGSADGLATTPGEAAQIDRKIDDGRPLSGYVRGSGAGLNTNDPCTASGGVDGIYNEVEKRKTCIMFFRVR